MWKVLLWREGAEGPGDVELGPCAQGLSLDYRTWHFSSHRGLVSGSSELEDRRVKGVTAGRWPVFPALLHRAKV